MCEALVCQPRGSGCIPSRKVLKIRPSKGEFESVFSSSPVEFQCMSLKFSIKSRLMQYALSIYHACMIIFSFVATKHLDIASYIP